MEKKSIVDVSAELKLTAIELLKSSLISPTTSNSELINFTFNVTIESKIDSSKKLIFVIVSIEIRDTELTHIVGSISVSCIYQVENFEEIIIQKAKDKLEIPAPLVDILNSISISTTRGVMFSTFKGTYLHNAVLPIIDPKKLSPNKEIV